MNTLPAMPSHSRHNRDRKPATKPIVVKKLPQIDQAFLLHQQGRLADAKAVYEAILLINPRHFDALHLLGVLASQTGNHQLAADLIAKAIAVNPDNSAFYSNLGNALKELKQLDAAIASYDKAISIKPDFADAYSNRGSAQNELKQFAAAVASCDKAIGISPAYAEAYYNRGNALHELKQFSAAVASYDQAVAIKPNYAIAYSNRGNSLQALNQFDAAIASYDKAISIKFDCAEAYVNRGNAYQVLKQFDAAIASYDMAIGIKSDCAEAYSNRGSALKLLQQFDAAIASFDNAISVNPNYAEAYCNRGIAQQELRQFDAAVASFDKAISIQPNHAEAHCRRGNALNALKDWAAAVVSFDKAICIKPDYAEAFYNRGNALAELKQYQGAIESFDNAIVIKPDLVFVHGTNLHRQMKICDWTRLETGLTELTDRISRNEQVTHSFPVLALRDSLTLQRKAAEIWAGAKYPLDMSLGAIPKRARKQKIRVGYYSADFHNHATAYLIAELFERHDRNKFELIAFSFGPDYKDEMRQRISASFDQFIDVRNQSDKEVAQRSRSLEIDIAVDLKGYTKDNRPGIFSYRAAPLQVNYLGYPGTMAADYIDYLIADKTLIPQDSQQHYSEKIIYLPNSYQVNDSQRFISDKVYSRQELGLPPTGFVFCCFNNNYKITPHTFDGWMRILQCVDGSVLWLFEDNPTAADNLRSEAERRGVDSKRLVFAARMPLAEHLARHRAADLFLDTLPCNAHTTASDALWAGLPLLTCSGESFASRVAASLLTAAGMPELISTTQEDYEALAIDLAMNPDRLRCLKEKLERNRLTTPLFNAKLFTQHLEAAFSAIVERYQADLAPDHIMVSENAQSPAQFASGNRTSLSQIGQAIALQQQGRLAEAQAIYEAVLKIDPTQFDALQLLGAIALQSKNYQLAADLIADAIAINPNSSACYANRGIALEALEQFDAAVASYDRAISIQPDFAAAYFNRGNTLQALKNFKEAVASFDKAIGIKPDFAAAYFNRGNTLHALKDFNAAIASYDKTIRIKPDHADAYVNRGNALNELNQHQAAIESFEKALAINPDCTFVSGPSLHTKMKICDWTRIDDALAKVADRILRNAQVTSSFPVLALYDSLTLQRKAAEIWTSAKYPLNASLGSIPKRARERKIRVGYYSADFHNHATAYLMAELFERHDRNKFELIAFSFGPDSKDEMRQRILYSFDQFIDVRDQSDKEVAQLSRNLGMDIAVDLKGYTGDSRSGIFSYRAAPLQVSYLGYPGTMGADYIDYLIADKILIPQDSRQHYSEKILYLPNSYQVNDTQRRISDKVFSRRDLGLPSTGFVFCCFNNNYKITPSAFDGWMRILKQVEGSVLWLLEDNSIAAANLRNEAERRGVDPLRLVFAGRMPLAEHLARHRAADLFLDTLPYNAHTTASDALWTGLPLLTCSGESFASRVAASLLTAVDMPELITTRQEDYEALAVDLAMNPERLCTLKEKLARNRLTTPLFNAKLFAQHLELAFSEIHERYHADLAPDHIIVSDGDHSTTSIASGSAIAHPQIGQAIVLQHQGRLVEAQAIYEAILKANPRHADALHLLGVVALQSNNPQLAAELIAKAISINPDDAAFYSHHGNALQALRQFDAAIVSYDKAISIKTDFAAAYLNRGNAFARLGQFDTAVVSYDKAISIDPEYAEAYFTRGNTLRGLKQFEAAVISYDKAISINADYADAYCNRGVALQELKQYDVAVVSYDHAIKIKPDFAEACANRGNALHALRQYQAAIESYSQAIAIKPDYAYLCGMRLHIQSIICDWASTESALNELTYKIKHNQKVTPSFVVLALCDSLSLQRKAAEIWTNAQCSANYLLGAIPKRERERKIRIGYYSADFHNHATAYLMAELFERHDRNKFELIAFSFGPDSKDEMRQRISSCFDQFIDVRDQSDRDVALRSRNMGIDIAVDLKGYTENSRAGIFSYRAAPLQINYLGYPGTMGADYIDYLIADKTLIPQDSRQHYSEKIIYLPNSYQVNDTQRRISDRLFSRQELGLPTTGFVFCCFNKNYKITPHTFDGWMRILKQVDESVLWLLEDNSIAAANLRNEAERRGVDPQRLVFAGRMPLAEHLARHRVADLFLDTLPYNAHTTASDALWAGLPVLTCRGESFASRVAASLLTAVDMPELITTSQEEYEALAIDLAANPERLHSLRQQLEHNRLTTPLFNAKLFAQHLEVAFSEIYERYHADLAPDHIMVNEVAQSTAQLTSSTAPAPTQMGQAIALQQQGRLAEAQTIYEVILKTNPRHFDALHLLGVIALQLKNYQLAADLIAKAISINPDDAAFYSHRGNALQALQQFDAAISSYDKAISIKSDFVAAYFNRGNAFKRLKQFKNAVDSYDQAIRINPNYAEAYASRGKALQELNQNDAAVASFNLAISLKPDYAEAYFARGNALQALNQYDTAIVSYDQAISVRPIYAEAFSNRGVALQALNRCESAVASYDQAIKIKPDYANAYVNRGNALGSLRQYVAAVDSFDKAISIQPDYSEAYCNRGNALNALKQFNAAVSSFDKAISLKPDYVEAFINRGSALDELKQYERAIESLDQAIAISPDLEFALGTNLHRKMKICSWTRLDSDLRQLVEKIASNKPVTHSFPVLALIDSLPLQRKAAEIRVNAKFSANDSLGAIPKRQKSQKIRIGYYSADFHNHATAYLMAELFEQHDRNRFELIAFSFKPAGKDAMGQRISASFDQFIDVLGQSDEEVAQRSRSLEIDIAVDLKGHTGHSRPGIFSYRAAPLQVSYLGYPGTLGADYIDYLIADKTLIPQSSQEHYSEKIIYLPNSYQVNDTQRQISDKVFSRQELGLPPTGFVFCCFNKNYKITPDTFDGWMRILKQVDGSVLWLFEDNPTAARNLRSEAERRGVPPHRFVFAKVMPLAEHLARHRAADLFLDTLPCNAHTTASDALWAGLPLLTCSGEAFASRVASSLLTALDMPELITTRQKDYEESAIDLATNPERLRTLKQKLECNRLTTPLFNAKLFAKNLEQAYSTIYERYHMNVTPDHIVVTDDGLQASRLISGKEQTAFTELTLYAACPLCRSDSFANYRKGDCSKYLHYKPVLSPTIQWMQCSHCSHIFRNGFYTDEACSVLFDETHASQTVGRDIEKQRIVSAKMIEKVLPFKSSGVWLDVGFGNGSLLFTAQEHGFHSVGLDLRKGNVEAIERFGIKAFCCAIEALKLSTKCSVISMADVLEHMPFPVEGLKAAHALLEDDGVLFLSMPNCDSMVWKLLDIQNANPYWGEMEHCHNFGRVRLYALLVELGFEPVRYGISERYRACMEIVARKT